MMVETFKYILLSLGLVLMMVKTFKQFLLVLVLVLMVKTFKQFLLLALNTSCFQRVRGRRLKAWRCM